MSHTRAIKTFDTWDARTELEECIATQQWELGVTLVQQGSSILLSSSLETPLLWAWANDNPLAALIRRRARAMGLHFGGDQRMLEPHHIASAMGISPRAHWISDVERLQRALLELGAVIPSSAAFAAGKSLHWTARLVSCAFPHGGWFRARHGSRLAALLKNRPLELLIHCRTETERNVELHPRSLPFPYTPIARCGNLALGCGGPQAHEHLMGWHASEGTDDIPFKVGYLWDVFAMLERAWDQSTATMAPVTRSRR